jgi:Ca-activated chloride channel family protein
MAKEKDIQIYAIGLTDWQYRQQVNATAILGDLAKTTGGRAYFPNYPRELEGICQKIGMDLKSQYMLGYRSTNPIKDGKWRKVKVKMASTKGLNVRARTGYYAPAVVRASK